MSQSSYIRSEVTVADVRAYKAALRLLECRILGRMQNVGSSIASFRLGWD